jgi:putative transposase
MVTPTQRREVVGWARTAYGLAERRACRAVGVSRSLVRYRSLKPAQGPLRRRLRELAASRVSWGYPRLTILLRREGWRVNHKRVYRLYTEEGLTLKRKRPKRRKSAAPRQIRAEAEGVNERWAVDFVHDVLAGGRTIRILTAIDAFSRECVALVAQPQFRGEGVAAILGDVGRERGALPELISVDNGTEFTSRALDHWAYWNQIRLDFSRPGKPTDNAHIESFNATPRRECLSQHWFTDLGDARGTLETWKDDYSRFRPHSSLGQIPPRQFRLGGAFTPAPEKLQNSPVPWT